MNITIVSLFPGLIEQSLSYSLLGRAADKGLVEYACVNPRDFTNNRHRQVDDYPYGGGPGMLIMAPPVVRAVESITGFNAPQSRLIMLSPEGRSFDHQLAQELSGVEHIIVICGHYEGIDERAVQLLKPELVSIGDFVTMGGEFPALCMVEAITRLIPGAIGDSQSAENDSFYNGALDFPHYTRPPEFRGMCVPEVLLSGHHKKISEWQRAMSLKRTRELRPDLFEKLDLSDKDIELLSREDL